MLLGSGSEIASINACVYGCFGFSSTWLIGPISTILEERSKESQFIMVSLKDSVIQKAKLIYGVFPKNGVSNVVTYKDKRMPSVKTT